MCEKGIRWEIGAGGGDQLLGVARPVLSRLWHELDVQDAIVAVEWEDDAVIEEELAGHDFDLSERPSQRRVGLVLIATGRFRASRRASTQRDLLELLGWCFSRAASDDSLLAVTAHLRMRGDGAANESPDRGAEVTLAVRPGPALEVLASAEALTEDLERLLVGDVRDGSPRSVSVSIS
jgi:hypothetical protein